MKYFLVLAIFVSGTLTSLAQKEATSRVSNRADNVKVKEITLTTAQQNWLNTNYKQLARLPKDSAATLVRKNFTSMDEATLEFLISQAARLQKGDIQNQIATLQQQLEQLKAERQNLLNRIIKKEAELGPPGTAIEKEKLRQEIRTLKAQVALLNSRIEEQERAIRRLQAG